MRCVYTCAVVYHLILKKFLLKLNDGVELYEPLWAWFYCSLNPKLLGSRRPFNDQVSSLITPNSIYSQFVYNNTKLQVKMND